MQRGIARRDQALLLTLTGLYVSLRLTEFCDKECQGDDRKLAGPKYTHATINDRYPIIKQGI